jgi:hypothetical protein
MGSDVAKLTAKARKAIPSKEFAGPDRSYPINDASHARNALSRVSQNGSPALKAKVRAEIHNKYPSIGDKSKSRERVSKWTEGKRSKP